MLKPITITIPHHLGRAEAQRRIADGFANIAKTFGAPAAKALKTDWQGDRMDFSVAAMGQAIAGHVEIQDAQVIMEVRLPAMLAAMAGPVKERLQREGQLMLEKS